MLTRQTRSRSSQPAMSIAGMRRSETARLLLITHAPLVKGSSRQQKRWLQAVGRVGHAVWLMLLAAREAAADDEASTRGVSQARAAGTQRGAEGGGGRGACVLERVRAVMLACSLLQAWWPYPQPGPRQKLTPLPFGLA